MISVGMNNATVDGSTSLSNSEISSPLKKRGKKRRKKKTPVKGEDKVANIEIKPIITLSSPRNFVSNKKNQIFQQQQPSIPSPRAQRENLGRRASRKPSTLSMTRRRSEINMPPESARPSEQMKEAAWKMR